MVAKPIKTLKLHYLMFMYLIIAGIPLLGQTAPSHAVKVNRRVK